MKNLKLFVLALMAFLVLSFNVNARTISESITLTEDSNEAIEVADNANVIIDLNGKTLDVTETDNDAIIINKGAIVTIKGNGIVKSKQAAVFNKDGNVTIENGSFDASVWYTIKNLGTMTINGGTFTQSNENVGNSSLIANGWASIKDKGVAAPEHGELTAKAIMTINGGTFNHFTTTSTIKSDDWSKTTINGGNFNSEKGTLVQATGEVLITDGNFVGYDNISLFNGTGDVGYEPAKLTITGGKFSAKYIIRTFTSGTLTVSGGEFDNILGVRNPNKEINEYEESITGGLYAVNIKEHLEHGYKTYSLNDKYKVAKTYEVLNHAGDNGKLTFDKDFAATGEVVAMTITPDKGYEIESIRIIDFNNNEIKVEDNKFVMPNSDVWVSVKFKAIQTVETPIVNEKNDVGVSNAEKTEEVLLDTLSKNDKYKDLSVSVELVVKDIKATEEVTNEFTEALKKEKVNTGKIVNYFDISVAVKNNITNKVEGYLTELSDKVEFTVALPEMEDVQEGYTRNYYVIKKHGDKVEVINATLSKDGKHIIFTTNEFSTYALAYEDVANQANTTPETNLEANPETNTESKSEVQPEVPQTFDGITANIIFGSLALISFVGISLYFKKYLNCK